jgi:hypothetical protein
MSTKNLGLVKAIHVGTTPPTNTVMLWYDTNSGVNIHKYYNVVTTLWVALNTPPTGSFDKNQIIPFSTAVTTLTIVHTLAKLPSVDVVDTTGVKINCQIKWNLSLTNTVYIDFISPQTGFVILN